MDNTRNAVNNTAVYDNMAYEEPVENRDYTIPCDYSSIDQNAKYTGLINQPPPPYEHLTPTTLTVHDAYTEIPLSNPVNISNPQYGQGGENKELSKGFLTKLVIGLAVLVIVLLVVIVIVVPVVLISGQQNASSASDKSSQTDNVSGTGILPQPTAASGKPNPPDTGVPEWSCRALLPTHNTNGNYLIDTDCFKKNVYCDQITDGGGWMRLHYKDRKESCTSTILWTRDEIKCMLDSVHTFDVAVSDNVNTIDREESWIFHDVRHFNLYRRCAGEPSCPSTNNIGLVSEGHDYYKVVENVFNCKTPTGTPWDQNYMGGYLSWTGKLATAGSWTETFTGCGNYENVGEDVFVRTGGHENHRGEFLHNNCNDYRPGAHNSITSLWSTDNTRVIWIRI